MERAACEMQKSAAPCNQARWYWLVLACTAEACSLQDVPGIHIPLPWLGKVPGFCHWAFHGLSLLCTLRGCGGAVPACRPAGRLGSIELLSPSIMLPVQQQHDHYTVHAVLFTPQLDAAHASGMMPHHVYDPSHIRSLQDAPPSPTQSMLTLYIRACGHRAYPLQSVEGLAGKHNRHACTLCTGRRHQLICETWPSTHRRGIAAGKAAFCNKSPNPHAYGLTRKPHPYIRRMPARAGMQALWQGDVHAHIHASLQRGPTACHVTRSASSS